MARQTEHGISYVDETWNPVRGCDPKMPCQPHCWARRMQTRHEGNPRVPNLHGFVDRATGNWTGKVALIESELDKPLHWRKSRRVAVCFMGDLFLAPFREIDEVFCSMIAAPQHTYFLLTKHPQRMHEYFFSGRHDDGYGPSRADYHLDQDIRIGVSARTQPELDARVTWLLKTPAAFRWLSLEPLLGPVTIDEKHLCPCSCYAGHPRNPHPDCAGQPAIDLVVVGGEAGDGAAPMHPQWARTVRDASVEAGVGFEFKQFGEWGPCPCVGSAPGPFVHKEHRKCRRISLSGLDVTSNMSWWKDTDVVMAPLGKRAAGRLLDGREWNGETE